MSFSPMDPHAVGELVADHFDDESMVKHAEFWAKVFNHCGLTVSRHVPSLSIGEKKQIIAKLDAALDSIQKESVPL